MKNCKLVVLVLGMSFSSFIQAMDLLTTSPLSACANAVRQEYTTTSHGSTEIRDLVWGLYSDTQCAVMIMGKTPEKMSSVQLGGNIYLCQATDSFSGIGGLACQFNFLSLRLISVTTDKGAINVTGNCMSLTCDGNLKKFASWTTYSSNTLTL